jgi:hypothetical protein
MSVQIKEPTNLIYAEFKAKIDVLKTALYKICYMASD